MSGDIAPLRLRAQRTAKVESESAYEAARKAYGDAEFEIAETLLRFERSDSTSDQACVELLRARIARHRGDADAGFRAATIAARDLSGAADRLLATALAATAARKLGRAPVAEHLFETVRLALGDASDENASAAALLADDAWHRRENDLAVPLLERYASLAKPHPAILTLLGRVEARRRRFRQAGKRFEASLAAGADGAIEVATQASTIVATLLLAVDTADVRLGRRGRRAYEALRWTPSIATLRYLALSQLRSIALLEGDAERAWIDAREATLIAPTPTLVVTSEIDAAVASNLIGDEQAFRLQLRRAWKALRAERRGEATDEERVALAAFAAEGAREMPSEAKHALALAQSLRAKRGPAPGRDARGDAFAAFARARVDEATGERQRAIEGYRDALERYRSLESSFRIALVASDLLRLTRDEAYREELEAALVRAPHAWLRSESSPADALGPKAREVLARLLVGESAKAIAADLDRSAFTVINHTRKIFEAFEVHSRDDLRRACAELGITTATLRRR